MDTRNELKGAVRRFLLNMILFVTSLPVIISLLFVILWSVLVCPVSKLVSSGFEPYGWMVKKDNLYKSLKLQL
jgi:uncharacterized membrane protein YdbT with pleckstrin-like domain